MQMPDHAPASCGLAYIPSQFATALLIENHFQCCTTWHLEWTPFYYFEVTLLCTETKMHPTCGKSGHSFDDLQKNQ